MGIGTFSCQKEPEEPDKPVQEPDLGIKGFDENGASYAYFSVSPSKVVFFSRGNLQYQASTNTWRFAPHQYDFIGADNLGAVFLPAAGERYDGTKVRDCGATGNYWTVYTANRPKTAYYMHFSTQSPDITITAKFYGFSVRPVFP